VGKFGTAVQGDLGDEKKKKGKKERKKGKGKKSKEDKLCIRG